MYFTCPSSRYIALWAENDAEWREVFGLSQKHAQLCPEFICTAGARVSDDMLTSGVPGQSWRGSATDAMCACSPNFLTF